MMAGNTDAVVERALESKKTTQVIRRVSTIGIRQERLPQQQAPGAFPSNNSAADRTAIRKLRREITETAVLTEVLASLLIFTLLIFETVAENVSPSSPDDPTTRLIVTKYASSFFPSCHFTMLFPDENQTEVFNDSAWCNDKRTSYCLGDFGMYDSKMYSVSCFRQESSKKRHGAILVYLVVMVLQTLGLMLSHRIVQYKNELSEKLERMVRIAKSSQLKLAPGLRYHFFLVSE
jgi:hypothetical protein